MVNHHSEEDIHDEGRKFFEVENTETNPSSNTGWTYSSRILGILTLVLLGSSRILLSHQCSVARTRKDKAVNPIVTTWRVTTKKTSIPVNVGPWKTARIDSYIDPGEIVEAYGEGTHGYMLLIEPHRGFAQRKGERLGHDFFERLDDEVESSNSCPILYDGWWPENKKASRFIYAPVSMAVAQQFWNAMQVFEILLLISMVYSVSTNTRKIAARWVTLVATCLLPFSHYVTSPGGSIFSVITLFTCIWAILENTNHTLCVGDKRSSKGNQSIVREEVLACICNLCCSFYNHHASRNTWPHWNKIFYAIDKFFGWVSPLVSEHSDYFNPMYYTMGMDVRIPMYLLRNNGSTVGANMFILIWSFLPSIYVCYFGCMYLLSSRSPYKKVQRFLCLFGIFHFLFLTDVVSYAYGRGFNTPQAEFFHWSERWAWRVAILLPIYQNCTNGHWMKGHRIPIVGKMVHYFMAVWGLGFLFQQVLCNDVEKTVQYLRGSEYEGLLQMMGLPSSKMFSYHGALVVMTIMYGLMLIGGFSHYRVFMVKSK